MPVALSRWPALSVLGWEVVQERREDLSRDGLPQPLGNCENPSLYILMEAFL